MNDLRRHSSAFALVTAMALLLAACGGAASDAPDGGGGDASAAPSVDAPASADAGGGSGGGSGSGGVAVPDDFESKLVPPNSSVTFTQSAGETKSVIFRSTSSFDELKSFYESAIDGLGGESFKQEIEGSFTIGFGDSNTGSGGLVVIVPSSEGGGYDVSVTTAIGS